MQIKILTIVDLPQHPLVMVEGVTERCESLPFLRCLPVFQGKMNKDGVGSMQWHQLKSCGTEGAKIRVERICQTLISMRRAEKDESGSRNFRTWNQGKCVNKKETLR